VLQRALEPTTGIGLHAVERIRTAGGWRAHTPGALDAELERELARSALLSFAALDCRDFARADFKLDADGRPCFLEINPLPTFAPDGSFAILAELAGRAPDDLDRGDPRRRAAQAGSRVSALASTSDPRAHPDWRDWTWQMQNRIRTARDLERYLVPTADERIGIERSPSASTS
jgi:hypothetical protein